MHADINDFILTACTSRCDLCVIVVTVHGTNNVKFPDHVFITITICCLSRYIESLHQCAKHTILSASRVSRHAAVWKPKVSVRHSLQHGDESNTLTSTTAVGRAQQVHAPSPTSLPVTYTPTAEWQQWKALPP